LPEVSGWKIPWNFCCQRLQDEKFHGIPVAGDSRMKNSMEFLLPETPGRKIPWNFCCRRLQDEKFHGIPVTGDSGTKNSVEFRIYSDLLL
jgi:hypothetical protein